MKAIAILAVFCIITGFASTMAMYVWLRKLGERAKKNKLKKSKIVLAMLALLISIQATPQNTGYLIVTETINPRHIKAIKVENPAVVDSIVTLRLGDAIEGFSCSRVFSRTSFVEIRTENTTLYIEKKEFVRKKNGKIKTKKL